jgi:hypothetical protein
VFVEPSNTLFQYCDALIHWVCYENWIHRVHFAAAHFDHWVPTHAVFVDWEIGYGLSVFEAFDRLGVNSLETGIEIPFSLADYDHWIINPNLIPKQHPFVQDVLNKVMPSIIKRFPNQKSLLLDTKRRSYIGTPSELSHLNEYLLSSYKFYSLR